MVNKQPYIWRQVKVNVPSNIAFVKYWGKRDRKLNLPLNDSISMNINALFAQTLVTIKVDDSDSSVVKSTVDNSNSTSQDNEEKDCSNGTTKNGAGAAPAVSHQKRSEIKVDGIDSVVLNGEELNLYENVRCRKVFAKVRRLLSLEKYEKVRLSIPGVKEKNVDFIRICVESVTNFPVRAGLASSAAGFGALAYALGLAFQFDEEDVARLARLGSGSATRSIYGGLVHWQAGVDNDSDKDCAAKTIFPADWWPELRCVVIVAQEGNKPVGSTEGMSRSEATSELLKHRVKFTVDQHVNELKRAFEEKNFEQFARIVMKDSNQLHAVCLDTYPPLTFLNEMSFALMQFVHVYNGELKIDEKTSKKPKQPDQKFVKKSNVTESQSKNGESPSNNQKRSNPQTDGPKSPTGSPDTKRSRNMPGVTVAAGGVTVAAATSATTTQVAAESQKTTPKAYDIPEKIEVAYTFDAGSHCCLIVEDKNLPVLLPTLLHYFGPSSSVETKFIRTANSDENVPEIKVPTKPSQKIRVLPNFEANPNLVQYIILSGLGNGPREVTVQQPQLNSSDTESEMESQ